MQNLWLKGLGSRTIQLGQNRHCICGDIAINKSSCTHSVKWSNSSQSCDFNHLLLVSFIKAKFLAHKYQKVLSLVSQTQNFCSKVSKTYCYFKCCWLFSVTLTHPRCSEIFEGDPDRCHCQTNLSFKIVETAILTEMTACFIHMVTSKNLKPFFCELTFSWIFSCLVCMHPDLFRKLRGSNFN